MCEAKQAQVRLEVKHTACSHITKHMSITNAYPQSAVLVNGTPGTGPASPLIDSSATPAEQLFAPFSDDVFSAELDIQALQENADSAAYDSGPCG